MSLTDSRNKHSCQHGLKVWLVDGWVVCIAQHLGSGNHHSRVGKLDDIIQSSVALEALPLLRPHQILSGRAAVRLFAGCKGDQEVIAAA